MNDLIRQRRFYAEEIETLSDLRTPELVDALATVPRERFLPAGPWTIRSETDSFLAPARKTPDSDPRRIYHNVAVAIEPERLLFNGAPSLLALCIDRLGLGQGQRVLHIGCGLGYYTAVMAQCVGPSGKVLAIEVDETLATAATSNLEALRQVQVQCGDGVLRNDERFDAVLVNAGVTHPLDCWLDAIERGGRLILPLTVTMPAMGPIGKGPLLLLTKRETDFEARAITVVSIYSAIGIRDATLNERLGNALMRGRYPSFTRLRRHLHDESPACWFHGPDFCLSA